MQSVLSRNWTRIAVSISCGDNHYTKGTSVWKWHNVQRARSEMRRCTIHALYRSKLWQQDHCQHPQNANPGCSTFEGTAQRIGRPFGGGGAEVSSEGHIMPPHIFEVGLKVNTKVYPDVLKCGDPLVQSGGRWQTLCVAAGLGAGPQIQRDPGLASEGVLRLCTLLSLAPFSPDLNPPDYFVWSYTENITNMTSTTPKPA